jgi:hypothetical protein
MFRLRWTIDAQARWKNGHPAHRTTGVDRELNPCRDLRRYELVQSKGGDVAAHFENEHRHSESGPDPKSPRHVRQFMVFADLRRRFDRLQCHSADGAIARPHLAYLRMHRAGVDDAGDSWGWGRYRCCA